MLMTALGCGFFAGFRTAAPAMMDAARDYVTDSCLMDLRLRSNIGVKSDEIAAVRTAEGVKGAFAGYTKELCLKSDSSVVMKAFSIPENISPDSVNFLNRPCIIEGRLPQAKNECAVEIQLTSPEELKVGGVITLGTADPVNDPLENTLAEDTFTITGIVVSPMFLGYERDSASIGDGTVNSNVYIQESVFTCDYYTDMYVTLELDPGLDPFSEGYRQAVSERGKAAEKAFEDSEKARYDKLISDAERKISGGEAVIERSGEILSEDREALEKRLSEAEALAEQTRARYGGSKSILAQAAVAQAEKQVSVLQSLIDDGDGSVRRELEAELEEARRELEEGRAQLAEAPELKIYRDDRFSFGDYESFRSDTEKTARLAQAFPPFFVLTAALVCLTAMSRMVEEQRTAMGTYRALGYGGGAVLSRFLLYGGTAALIGGAGGAAAGMAVLPGVLMNTYKVLYNIPLTRSAFDAKLLGYSAAASVLLVCGAAAFTCRKELSSVTAELMRPRPPAAGKRTLLEMAGFIWNRLGFISKVTARNIFRYKKRALMTIAGTAGCCALIAAGLGLRSSVVSILDRQFGDIFVYSALCGVSDESAAEDIRSCPGVKSALPAVWMNVSGGTESRKYGVFLISADGGLGDYITLRDPETGGTLSPEGGVVVTEKLAKLCGFVRGSEIEIRTPEGGTFSAPITGITENYALNFVYADRALCDEKLPGGFAPNTVFINAEEGAERASLGARLTALESVQGVSWLSDTRDRLSGSTGLMDRIVAVLVVCAMMLAATVLFELADININERRREIASLKVLGFYDGETAAYIFRETFLLTLTGLIPGALLGKLLHRYVISAVEIDALMFIDRLDPAAVGISALLTAVFSLAVSGALFFKLKKIGMVESLKSVE